MTQIKINRPTKWFFRIIAASGLMIQLGRFASADFAFVWGELFAAVFFGILIIKPAMLVDILNAIIKKLSK